MANVTFEGGTYRATLSRGVLGKGKNYPQIVFTFTCQGRINPARPGELEGCPEYERSIFRAISENTIEYVVQDLERLGYPHKDFDHLSEGHPQQHDFAGQEVDVICEYEEYEGKNREKWRFTGGVLKVESLASAEVRKLNALFGKHLKNTNKPVPVPVPVPVPKPNLAPQVAEEELAF